MPNLRLYKRFGLLSIVGAVLIAALAFQAMAEEYRSPSDGIQSMVYEDGRLSLEAKDASLDKLLTELARIAMVTIIADGPIEGRVTAYADRVPLEKALRKILRGKGTSFVYSAREDTSPTEYDVTEVRIYLAKADKGEARRYTYTQRKEEKKRSPRPPSTPAKSPRKHPSPFQMPAGTIPVPDMATAEEGQRILSDLMEGNLDGLDKLVEKLKDQNPQVEAQIDQFLESLEDMRERAEESGQPLPSFEGLGDMETLMEQMLETGRMSPGEERE